MKLYRSLLHKRLGDQLIELDVTVDYNEYNATHTIANDCLNDFMSWIKPLSQQ